MLENHVLRRLYRILTLPTPDMKDEEESKREATRKTEVYDDADEDAQENENVVG